MTFTHKLGVLRAVSAAIGVIGAIVLLISAAPPARPFKLPATVSFAVPTTGELAITPSAPQPVLIARALRPGGSLAEASFQVRNQTSKTLALGFRANSSSTALDGLLMIHISGDGRRLVDTTLQGLHHGSLTHLLVASGQTCRVRLQAWIPREITVGYEGELVAVSLIPTVST